MVAILQRFSVVVLAFALVAANKEMLMGDTSVMIDDNGGMEFQRRLNGIEEVHPIKITMNEIVQVDENGLALTTCDEPTDLTLPGTDWVHNSAKSAMSTNMKKFTDFATQKFDFGDEQHSTDMSHGDMKASGQRFSAALPDGIGTMAIDMSLPEEDGEIDVGGEKHRMRKGDMKFNIEMSEWLWCDNAAFVDVYIKVEGKQNAEKKHERNSTAPAVYDLGDNVTMSFSGKFMKDAEAWADMAEGFPKVDLADPTRFIVRFPRFNNTLVYDPTVSGEEADSTDDNVDGTVDGDSDSGANGLSMSAILVAMAMSIYAMLK